MCLYPYLPFVVHKSLWGQRRTYIRAGLLLQRLVLRPYEVDRLASSESTPPESFVGKYHINDMRREIIAQLRTENQELATRGVAATRYMDALYRLRVCTTFPVLAKISMDHGLKLTGREMKDNNWMNLSNDAPGPRKGEQEGTTVPNPYMENFDAIIAGSPKFDILAQRIEALPEDSKFLIFTAAVGTTSPSMRPLSNSARFRVDRYLTTKNRMSSS